MMNKSLSYYLNKAEKLIPSTTNQPKKVAILSNFTLKGITEVIKVISNEQGMDIEVYESPYNQYKQEVIDINSIWYNYNPDLSFIILDFDSYLGDLKFRFYSMSEAQRNDMIKQMCEELENLLRISISKQTGKIVISNFVAPIYSPYGIFDPKIKYSMKDLVYSLNSVIRDLSLTISSLFVLEMDAFVQRFGKSNLTDEKLRYLADMKISPSYIPELGYFLMSFIKPLFGRTRKCLVLDLDNTLWGGILGEDGINDIKLDEKPPGNSYLEFQKTILELHNRGIILAINSKNNPGDVKEVFENHPNMILKESHFASTFVNWNDKATNLIGIANELNIGVDSMVYFDDDPINRELIKEKIPEVLVVDVPKDPSLYADVLRNLDDFNSFHITEEDLEKGKMYASQKQRKTLEKQFSDLNDFLASLDMEVTVRKGDEFTTPRIAQLTMKTNQFNLTTKRYSEEQIKKMINDQNFIIKTFSVYDKFGDNGLTGLYIIEKENSKKWVVDTFLMSCRVMGRNIENVMISDVLEEAKHAKVEEIVGKYVSTKKNEVTKDLYHKFGFQKINDSEFVLKNIECVNNQAIPYISKKIVE